MYDTHPYDVQNKETTGRDRSATYTDIFISFDDNNPNFPFSGIKNSPISAYYIIASQLILYANLALKLELTGYGSPGGTF